MKKFIKVLLAVVMAVTFMGLAACSNGGGTENKDKTYSVTLNLDGGSLAAGENITSYVSGTEVTLPTPTKNNCTFGGWYNNQNCTGTAVTKISTTDTGNKTYWAKWNTSSTPTPTTYTVTLNLNSGTVKNNLTSYTQGVGATLPTPERSGYTFDGWFDNQNCTGTAVTKISTTDTGNKTYWAKWTPVTTPAKTYTVTLNLNSGTLKNNLTSYTQGVGATLPTPERSGYTFDGWFDNQNCTGTAVTKISTTDTGNKTYWAKWTPVSTPAKTYTVTLNLNSGTVKNNLTSYTQGVGATLPTPERSGYTFDGWFDNQNCTGTAVTKISTTDTGNKTYWAKWTPIASGTLQLSDYAGYAEGAYVEFSSTDYQSDCTVSYKKDGASSYTKIDSELIRNNGSKVRADIVGLSAGGYSLQIVSGAKSATCNVTVTSQDRSGYAHFNYAFSSSNLGVYDGGVGAYKDDGTPKDNAHIVYVTESNKNDDFKVVVNGKTKTYAGIVKLLQDAKNLQPLIVRVVGTVGAATWNEKRYEQWFNSSNQVTPDIVVAHTSGLSKKTYTSVTQSDGTESNTEIAAFNSFNTSVYSKLTGLSNTLKYDSSKKEFDSCWNDCAISNAKNITVEGIGTDATIFQWGFTWKSSNSVEIRNLTFSDYTEDACSFQGSSTDDPSQYGSYNIWVHNCTFNRGMNYWDVCNEQDKHDGDGATDFKNVGNVTVSYNRYYNNHKTGLVGSGSTSYSSNITFHHNFYDQCESRLPMGRQANIHLLNNYYRKTSNYCLSARDNMYAFVEACYFENCNQTVITDGTGAVVKLWNNTFSGCSYDTENSEIVKATSRSQVVTSNNFMVPSDKKNDTTYCLDNDSTLFYLNSDGTTKGHVTSAADAKWECINKAGTLKSSSWTEIKTDSALIAAYPLKK